MARSDLNKDYLAVMSGEKIPVELSKGINGLEKVILRDPRGSSAEVPETTSFHVIHLFFFLPFFISTVIS